MIEDEDRPGVRLHDVIREAMAGIWGRPGRSGLTVVGTVLGVAAFVATVGITTTAAAQVSSRFDALKATEVAVQDSEPDGDGPAFTPDLDERLAQLNGVEAAGVWWTVELEDEATVSAGRQPGGAQVDVVAASPGALRALRPTMLSGASFSAWHAESRSRVALVGSGAARELALGPADGYRAVFVDGEPFTVVGVIQDVARRPGTLLSVIVPGSTADERWPGQVEGGKRLLIETRPGAAQVVGEQVAAAVRPHDPDRLTVVTPPDPKTLRQNISADVAGLLLLMAGVSLLIGAFGIANTTLVSVLERTNEIGLRRALGAQRRHIAVQFLTESGLLGTAGGVIGTCLAVIVVVAVSLSQGWHAVMAPHLVLPAPLLGAVTGLVAGVHPAWRATRIEPLGALRR